MKFWKKENFILVTALGAVAALSIMVGIEELNKVLGLDFISRYISLIASGVIALTSGFIIYLKPKRGVLYGFVIGYLYSIINLTIFHWDIIENALTKVPFYIVIGIVLYVPVKVGFAGLIGAILGKFLTHKTYIAPGSEIFYGSKWSYVIFVFPLIVFSSVEIYRGWVELSKVYLDWITLWVVGVTSLVYLLRNAPVITVSPNSFTYRRSPVGELHIPINQIESISHKVGGKYFDKHGSLHIKYLRNGKSKNTMVYLFEIQEPERLISKLRGLGLLK